MALDNTRYSRAHEQKEDKAAGESKVNSAADVLSHKRGSALQMAELFVGMARAAGMNAYLMMVPDRSKEMFTPGWLSFDQFDDAIAIVNVDGKERYFDPGYRYCGYGHLAWEHTFVQGLRQSEKGTEFGKTEGDGYAENRTTRVANLNMDDDGQISGTIKMTFSGAAALRWRHAALEGDEESLKRGLQTHLEEMVPKSLEVRVSAIDNERDYEQPLTVNYAVSGRMGTSTGKRLILPVDLFEAGATATFSDETRVQAVYFEYPECTQDALRVNFSNEYSVEALPALLKLSLPQQEIYTLELSSTGTSFTARRNHVQDELLVMPKDYGDLRKFYTQFEGKDRESVVLKETPVTTAAGVASGQAGH